MRFTRLGLVLAALLLWVAPVSAQSTNIFLNGIPPSVNSGTKDTGTVRVVVATDQPQNTNAWLVTGIGGTFPATQSGTWTVQPGNTANTTAWLVTGLGGTFPATQSGSWTVGVNNYPTTVGTAIAVRCVDTTGATFEACGGSGGSGTEYTEDTAAAANPVGGALIAVRSDTLGAVTDANGDNVALRATNNGELYVKQTDTVHVDDNAGSLTVDGLLGRQPTYGSKQTIAWTGTSLGSASARQSDVVTWTSTRCADGRIRIQSKGQASGTSYVDWYVYTSLGDTTYTDGASGADGTFTAANRFNSRYLGSLKMNAATSAVQGEFQLSDIFGSMPDKWGLIGINNSGAALSATAGDHVIEYQCIN